MTCAAALLCLLGAGAAVAVQSEGPSAGQVRPILLPLQLPAIMSLEPMERSKSRLAQALTR
jgi:hypothetical protein